MLMRMKERRNCVYFIIMKINEQGIEAVKKRKEVE